MLWHYCLCKHRTDSHVMRFMHKPWVVALPCGKRPFNSRTSARLYHYITSRCGHLKIHMRRHSAERDFKCNYPQCTGSFKLSSYLKRHLSNLHGAPKIQCDRPGYGQYVIITQVGKSLRITLSFTTIPACPSSVICASSISEP